MYDDVVEYLLWHSNATPAIAKEEKEPEAPPEFLLMLESEQNGNALPWLGGLLNQPHILMQQWLVCRNARHEAETVIRVNRERQNGQNTHPQNLG